MAFDQTRLSIAVNSNWVNRYIFLLVLAAVSLPVAVLLVTGNSIAGLLALGALIAGSLAFYPRACFYVFLLSVAVYIPYRIGGLGIHPFDIAMSLLMASVVLDYLLNVRTEIRPATFDFQFFLIITATVLSAIFAYKPGFALVPTVRTILLYFAFRLTFKFALEIGVRRLLSFYVYAVAMLSLFNCGLYILNGDEERIFGIAWLTYETFAMTALPVAMVFLIWSRSTRQKLLYTSICLLIGMGILVTQSRAPLLAVLTSVPVLMTLSYLKAHRENKSRPKQNLRRVILLAIVAVTVLFVFKSSFFTGAFERYQLLLASLHEPQGTVALRLVLWSAAWQAFLSSPIIGIGIGNFRLVYQIIPEVAITELWTRVANMSAHNVFLQYLAETGIIGASALLALAWKGLTTSVRSLRQSFEQNEIQVSISLIVTMFLFATTIFYMRDWTWGQTGYVMAFLFGLNAAWKHQIDQSLRQSPMRSRPDSNASPVTK